MPKIKEMSMPERRRALINLILDAESLNFNPALINSYKNQLKAVEMSLLIIKEQKKYKIEVLI